MHLLLDISNFFHSHIEWLIISCTTLITFIMYLNAINYQKYIKVFWEDIYDIEGHTNNVVIKRDKKAYITAVFGILRMKHKRVIFYGIFSTILWFIIMFSLRKIDKLDEYWESMNISLMSEEEIYNKYKEKLKTFDTLFPFLYWCIHHGRGQSIWIKKSF